MSNKVIKNAVLMEVKETVNDNITFGFHDLDGEGSYYEVVWNLRKWNNESTAKVKWEDSHEQIEQVERWSQEIFGVPMKELKNLADGQVEGAVRKDIYTYVMDDKMKCYLWELDIVDHFDKDRVGEIITTKVTDVTEDGNGIHVYFEEDGKKYVVNYKYVERVESLGKDVHSPAKELKSKARFKEVYGIDHTDKDKLIGEEIMVEIRLYGQYTWNDAKKLTDARKKALQSK